ncbi:MAG: hypothetical protein O3A53_18380 [Acidobacteria bacterium]|nr:hypothetical protein [Acidobacteriota bacterium]
MTETYVYDAFGRLAAEYSTAGPSGTPGSYFRTTDHLGSTRLVTDGSGNVYDRRDFFPFGEKILASSTYSNRQYVTGYNNTDPASAHLFTAKERDEESGLDYFLARYYSGALGRFTSPDAPFADQREENPKTWNLYSYVLNQPMLYVDPSGRECISTDDGGTADDGRGSFCDDNSLKKTHGVIVSANSSPFYTAFGDPIALGDIDLSGASDSISDASSELIDFIPSGKALKSGAVLASITLGVLRGSAGKFVKFSTQRALQRKWKHAAAFGVGGNFSHTGAASFQKAIVGHVNSPSTLQIRGTLRGIDGDVIHHYNPATGLNVTTTMDGEFVSGWKLSAEQAGHVVSTGKLGGGQ